MASNAVAESELFEFEIETVSGRGGFGIAYLAIDTLLQEQVAIKEYLPNDMAVPGVFVSGEVTPPVMPLMVASLGPGPGVRCSCTVSRRKT